MSRSTSLATDRSPSQNLDTGSNDLATRPLPRLTPFDLEAEARRLDALACALDDSDSTLMIGADENKRLLASAFALEARGSRPAHDDEPTVAARAPHLFLVPSVEVEVEPAPATLRMLVAIPPAAVPPPPSGMRPRITSEVARAARDVHASAAPRAAAATASTWLPRTTSETWVVVAIWSMALSLIALLALMVRS